MLYETNVGANVSCCYQCELMVPLSQFYYM